MKIAVYPGSFDPITNGHLDVIKRAAKMFDKVVVAVLDNSSKNPVFTQKKRMEMIKQVTDEMENVEVAYFEGLLVDYCTAIGANFVIKGLRAVSDFEYEFQMALTNKHLCGEIDTVFLTAQTEYMYLSSSIVKEVARYGGDISDFVPPALLDTIKAKLKKN